MVQNPGGFDGVVQKQLFGNFQLQQFRGQATVFQGSGDQSGKGLITELPGRDVDRDDQGLAGLPAPVCSGTAGFSQYPFSDFCNQSCFFGQGMKRSGMIRPISGLFQRSRASAPYRARELL